MSAAVALVILLAGCGGGAAAGEELQALEDDPIARYSPAGARVVDARGRNEGEALGKPTYASYRRLLELPAGDPAEQLRSAVEAATASGWTIDGEPFRSGGDISQSGRKRLATGEAVVEITVFPNGPPSGRARGPALLIVLSHFGARR